LKGIREVPLKLLQGSVTPVHRHVHLLLEIERPQIIEARGVIAVRMCKDYGINTGDIFSKHLHPEIWSCIDHKTSVVNLQVD
jgi:hypothetical protein